MRRSDSQPYPGAATPGAETLQRALPRRGVLLGGLGLSAATLLAACSSDKKDNDSGSPTGSSTAPKSQSSSLSESHDFPVTVDGKEGSAKLSAAPKRVVAAGYLRDTDLALALGAPLVGAARNAVFSSGWAPWQNAHGDATLFDTTNGLPYEKIAAYRPDLIMASDDYTLAKDYKLLSQIAPTLSYQASVGGDSWQTMTTRAGEILGRRSTAQDLIDQVQKAVAATKSSNPVLNGKTFTFGPVSAPNSIYTINDAEDASAAFFAQLGMTLSPKVTALPDSSTPRRAALSLEQLTLIDADVVILSYPTTAIQKQFESQPAFKKLAAVRRGSYVAFDMATAVAVAFPSVLSLPYGLTNAVPKVAAAASKS